LIDYVLCKSAAWRWLTLALTLCRRAGTTAVSARFAEDHAKEVYAWAGSMRNITCQSQGVPTPRLDWMIGDRVLRNNDTYRIFDQGATSHLQVGALARLLLSLSPTSMS